MFSLIFHLVFHELILVENDTDKKPDKSRIFLHHRGGRQMIDLLMWNINAKCVGVVCDAYLALVWRFTWHSQIDSHILLKTNRSFFVENVSNANDST